MVALSMTWCWRSEPGWDSWEENSCQLLSRNLALSREKTRSLVGKKFSRNLIWPRKTLQKPCLVGNKKLSSRGKIAADPVLASFLILSSMSPRAFSSWMQLRKYVDVIFGAHGGSVIFLLVPTTADYNPYLDKAFVYCLSICFTFCTLLPSSVLRFMCTTN